MVITGSVNDNTFLLQGDFLEPVPLCWVSTFSPTESSLKRNEGQTCQYQFPGFLLRHLADMAWSVSQKSLNRQRFIGKGDLARPLASVRPLNQVEWIITLLTLFLPLFMEYQSMNTLRLTSKCENIWGHISSSIIITCSSKLPPPLSVSGLRGHLHGACGFPPTSIWPISKHERASTISTNRAGEK